MGDLVRIRSFSFRVTEVVINKTTVARKGHRIFLFKTQVFFFKTQVFFPKPRSSFTMKTPEFFPKLRFFSQNQGLGPSRLS